MGTDILIAACNDSYVVASPANQNALYCVDQTGFASKLLVIHYNFMLL